MMSPEFPHATVVEPTPDTVLARAQALLARIEASEVAERDGITRFIAAIDDANTHLKQATLSLDTVIADLQVVTGDKNPDKEEELDKLLNEAEQEHDLEEQDE